MEKPDKRLKCQSEHSQRFMSYKNANRRKSMKTTTFLSLELFNLLQNSLFAVTVKLLSHHNTE